MSSVRTTSLAEAAYTEDLATRAQTQWFARPKDERFETLDALEAAVLSRRSRSTSEIVDVKALLPKTNGDAEEIGGRIVLSTGTDVLTPTNWAFTQLAQKVKAPSAYLRTLPARIVSDAIAYGLQNVEAEQVKVLALEPKAGTTDEPMLQALTGPEYGRVWDADVVAGAKALVASSSDKLFNPPDWSGKASGLYASDRDCFILLVNGGSIVNGGGERDQLHRGIMISNSEVGKASLRATSFRFRQICGNHLLWGSQTVAELRIPHYSNAPERFANEMLPELTRYFHSSVAAEEAQIRRAKAYSLPAKEQDAAKLISRITGVSERMATKAMLVATSEEGHCANLWDALQGLTAVARTYDHADSRSELERQAGKLMDVVAEKASEAPVIDAIVVS